MRFKVLGFPVDYLQQPQTPYPKPLFFAGSIYKKSQPESIKNILYMTVLLHHAVFGASSAFRWYPDDIFIGIFDITGLAVNAVLRVDLEARGAIFVFNHFVDPGRAVALRRLVVQRQIMRLGDLNDSFGNFSPALGCYLRRTVLFLIVFQSNGF